MPEFWICVAVYFLPCIVALVRGRVDTFWVALVNITLGWTVIYWLYALCLASRGTTIHDLRRQREREDAQDALVAELTERLRRLP